MFVLVGGSTMDTEAVMAALLTSLTLAGTGTFAIYTITRILKNRISYGMKRLSYKLSEIRTELCSIFKRNPLKQRKKHKSKHKAPKNTKFRKLLPQDSPKAQEIVQAWKLARQAYGQQRLSEFIIRSNAAIEMTVKFLYSKTNGKSTKPKIFTDMIESLRKLGIKMPPQDQNKHWRKIRNQVAHGTKVLTTKEAHDAFQYYSEFMKVFNF